MAGERGWAAVEGAGTEDAASGHERAWKHAQWAHDDMMTITGHVALPGKDGRANSIPRLPPTHGFDCCHSSIRQKTTGAPRPRAAPGPLHSQTRGPSRSFHQPPTLDLGAPQPPPRYALWPQVAAQVDCVLGSVWGSHTSHLAGHRTQVRPLRSPRAAVFSRLELWPLPRHTEAWQTHTQTTDGTELTGMP